MNTQLVHDDNSCSFVVRRVGQRIARGQRKGVGLKVTKREQWKWTRRTVRRKGVRKRTNLTNFLSVNNKYTIVIDPLNN